MQKKIEKAPKHERQIEYLAKNTNFFLLQYPQSTN